MRFSYPLTTTIPTGLLAFLFHLGLQAQLPAAYQLKQDWLLDGDSYQTQTINDAENQTLTLQNGLISRTWKLRETATTISFMNLMTGNQLLRALRPEARFVVDGTPHEIGPRNVQPNHAYLASQALEGLDEFVGDWKLASVTFGQPTERFPWKRVRHHAPNVAWPPNGKSVHFHYQFKRPQELPIEVTIHYEMYDGIPALSKWITIKNDGTEAINLDSFTSEILAMVPYEDPVEFREGVAIAPPDFHVETDFAFGGFTVKNSQRHTVHWVVDPDWKSQVNWARQNPCLLEIRPPIGPDQTILPSQTFETFRAFELVYDSTERERQGLALRRLYRTIAPWVTENPLVLHVVSTKESVVKQAIDQASECGFEMVSLSFGSGLNMEDESESNLEKFRSLADYAGSKGLHLGGYSLLSSRRIKPDLDNIINPETGKPGGQTHGFCPALASPWGQQYFQRLSRFFDETGFLQFTHDGSYPGDIDAASRPPLQKGEKDSQWVQWRIITDFYQKLRAKGAYVRVPDYYFLSGANECGMGYREVNWSLPRLQQQIHTRQNIYDGTWQKTPSMGWMFVPLTQYHGGGAAATIEPLHQNLAHYGTMLASNLGAGVQAVYRGHRLYDTAETKQTVRQWVQWYQTHRDILESDIIHSTSRRANGQELDWFFHANAALDTKGFLVVYNPLNREQKQPLNLNLYYTGLTDFVEIAIQDSSPIKRSIDSRHRAQITVAVPPRGTTWVSFKMPKNPTE